MNHNIPEGATLTVSSLQRQPLLESSLRLEVARAACLGADRKAKREQQRRRPSPRVCPAGAVPPRRARRRSGRDGGAAGGRAEPLPGEHCLALRR